MLHIHFSATAPGLINHGILLMSWLQLMWRKYVYSFAKVKFTAEMTWLFHPIVNTIRKINLTSCLQFWGVFLLMLTLKYILCSPYNLSIFWCVLWTFPEWSDIKYAVYSFIEILYVWVYMYVYVYMKINVSTERLQVFLKLMCFAYLKIF